MSNDILESSPLYQEWMREWTEKGRQEGIQEGIQEGRQEGLRQGTLAVLTGRFGELPPDLAAALAAASADALQALMPFLASISLEELRARLGLS